jgi:hypothetical protein
MLDQQQKLDHGHKLNNAKLKMILRRHKQVVGQRKTSGFFFGFLWTMGDEHNMKSIGK